MNPSHQVIFFYQNEKIRLRILTLSPLFCTRTKNIIEMFIVHANKSAQARQWAGTAKYSATPDVDAMPSQGPGA
jgi:hypothetical protein